MARSQTHAPFARVSAGVSRHLCMHDGWDIDEGTVNSVLFFRVIAEHFPEATTLFAEGTSISKDVQTLYEAHADPGKYLPGAQILWPTSKKFRCVFSSRLCSSLSALAEHHAEPELLHHLFLYTDSEPLLEWHDAFANVLMLSETLSESRVQAFAAAIHLPYGKANAG